MKFNMIVLMTSCEPKRALSTPGIAPHTAPAATAASTHSGSRTTAGQAGAVDADPGRRERADVELSLGADVEQPAAERDRRRRGR